MSQTEINDLPNELLFSILKHLEIKEKPPCRLVCKRFLSICDEIKVTELVISNTIGNINDYWFSTNEPFNHKDAIDVATFMSCRSKFQSEMFLRRLYFKGTSADYRLLNVNGLTHLEQLTLHIIHTTDAGLIDINLPNLKVIDHRPGFLCVLHLNTPKLRKLKCTGFYSVQFFHPDTIKHLELDSYFETAASLKNIEYLKAETAFERIKLENHPQLKHLDFNPWLTDDESFKTIRKLYEEKGRHLQFYFQSVKLEDVEKIEQYDRNNELGFQISNYNLLTDHVHCYTIDYNKLMEMVNDTIPNDFYKKYSTIRKISVTGNVKNTFHFIGFLKSFRYLNVLSLNDSHFDRGFYDFLPELDQLRIITLKKLSEPIASYDFLFKMSRLRAFTTDQDPQVFFDMAEPLFQQLKYLVSFHFCFKKDFISIYKNSNNSYSFRQVGGEDGTRAIIFDKDVNDLSLFLSWFINSNL